MDRSNSASTSDTSSNSNSNNTRSTASSNPFAYQTRLLERTSSLSRSNSVSSRFPSPANSTTPQPTRRWIPTHHVGRSVDTIRSKWEERAARAEPVAETSSNDERISVPKLGESDVFTPTPQRASSTSENSGSRRFRSSERPPILQRAENLDSGPTTSVHSPTPPRLKRHTLPTPISLPLSPDASGSSPSFATPAPNRIRVPASVNLETSSISAVKHLSDYAVVTPVQLPSSDRIASPSSAPFMPLKASIEDTSPFPVPDTPTPSTRYSQYNRAEDTTTNETPRPLFRASSLSRSSRSSSAESRPLSSVMTPTPYRSSYMAGKKAATYGSSMVVGRKLGRHLPRIASGDGNDHDEIPNHAKDRDAGEEEEERRLQARRERRRKWNLEHGRDAVEFNMSPTKETQPDTELVIPGITGADDVQGMRGRIRLAKSGTPTSPGFAKPLPSAKLGSGLWADVQRHLLQAYEYLCHVGEAQQWIEGCLMEELGFGVVEMEEGLRNGVVLAKLVRSFEGNAVVRRIYEAPKLDYRHSDNINCFFDYVRRVGLPEGFIFELTDLYNKKNLPKVIYCIHALSHLLARRGVAQRIGNLVGRLKFSDDQLQQTQKGLKDAGVAMPNFGNVRLELAKEINEEPDELEEEIETEDERRDRLLLECESSILALQSMARGFLLRKTQMNQRARLRLGERHVISTQARCRGVLERRRLSHEREQRRYLVPWVIALQATARGVVSRRRWRKRLAEIRRVTTVTVKLQAQVRGVLARRRLSKLKTALRGSKLCVVKLQSFARARIVKRHHKEIEKVLHSPVVFQSIALLQAAARGALERRRITRQLQALRRVEAHVVGMQAHIRAVLMRRRIRNQLASLDDASDIVLRIQAASRAYLARKQLLNLIRGLRKATPAIVGMQALARAKLARYARAEINKALGKVQVATAVGGFQALARAALTRNRHREQQKQLDFVEPDVVQFQAAARGALVRSDFLAWRDHLHQSHPAAVHLQSLFRGLMERRKFRAKMEYYRANLGKVVKIQSLFRAKETREQYRQLTLGKNVNVGTIKNFVHLLDDSEADFEDEIELEQLRKHVVESIRENQQLETELNELDVKIALVVQNVKSSEELIKARRRHGADSAAAHATRASVLAAHGDPFATSTTLDHASKRKLEFYKQLFYLLQSKGEYLARLFFHLSRSDVPEKSKRSAEHGVLTLFGYGQDRREEYLLLKLLQICIRKEIKAAQSIEEVIHSHPMYMAIAVRYVRPKQVTYVRETLQTVIREVIDQKDLDLETDPAMIYRARIEVEEIRSGKMSNKRKDLTYHEAVGDPDTRAEFIRHLQVLQALARGFVDAILNSTKKMPYGMQCIAREILQELRARFPNAGEEQYGACIGRVIFYRFINPAIVTPETFDIVSSTVDGASRKNLAEISKILTQISSGQLFGDDDPCLTPINGFVESAISQMSRWFLEIANVPDAETQFHAHEFLDVTVQPKPVYISPNEVYSMHLLLAQHLDKLVSGHDDPLRVVLTELDGVPNLGTEELNDARDRAITLELTNRFALVKDPLADEKALWVQCKRGVLAILRVQPAKDLLESLFQEVEEEHEFIWEDIVHHELVTDRRRKRRMPSTTGPESAYRLEDIRALSFRDVKANAITYLLQLEKKGKITRSDGYQGILNAIASDVRSKHRKRLERQNEIQSMQEARSHLVERKKYFEEQIGSYHSYVQTAMNTMQRGKGKKRFVIPFTKQYFHLRELQKSGKNPQFGSYRYSAQELYAKGILLSIDQFSPRQFDRIDIVISSNEVGLFAMEVYNSHSGVSTLITSANIRMEDLLQAQFESRVSLPLFKGMAKFNLNLLLYQINKKFYV
ncbi:ras GTPase-activating protein [Hysterangium stoloniferum]|nr:ras GTPase-activating protein [Hysterangium stoloniferum]